jgi:phosphoglycerol transferase MdoB-like AlkP superfamily enzyme
MTRAKPLLSNWIAPLAAVAAMYFLFQWIAAEAFGVAVRPAAYAADLALHLVLGGALLAMSRNRWAFLALMAVLMLLLHVGNAIKLAILGGPIMPDDVLAVRSLLLLLQGWWLALAVGFLMLLAGALAIAINLRPRRAWAGAGVLAALVLAVFWRPEATVAAMDARFGNVVWNQSGNYLSRGPLVHLVQEGARYAARGDAVPDLARVAEAAERLRPSIHMAALTETVEPVHADLQLRREPYRNVHVILLETFWDPSVLEAAKFSRDPFDERFRALWKASGNTRALVPVFGGYTANSEFEALCGFPVTQDWVFFEARLRNKSPCLPRALQELGYTTLASHPNVAAFWNRVNAYDRAGFNLYWSAKDFRLDDMNGDFLGDASLYAQVLEKIDPLLETETPTLNYIVTFFGHLEYPLNESRPKMVEVRGKGVDPVVERYANTVYYKSKELMAFLDELRARDPDAVIVLFGDHLPFLGGNFDAYAQSGVLAASRDAFNDEMFRDQYSTPLIVIDGRNGPLKLGAVPLYRLPSIVLALLDQQQASPMDLTRMPRDMVVRPLPGLNVVLTPDGGVSACRGLPSDGEVCEDAARWLDAVGTVGADLFYGRQHVLKQQLMPDMPAGGLTADLRI